MPLLGVQLAASSGAWDHVRHEDKNQRSYSIVGGINGLQYIMPANGYIYHIGAWMRRSHTNNNRNTPHVWFAIYEVSDEGEPGRLLGYTGRLSVGNNGGQVSGNIIWTNPILNIPASGSVRVSAGQRIGIAFKLERENAEFARLGPDVA
jgi:hypothetical protein